ncbi:MAG: hypothetical protein QXN24_06555 [Candidatus Bathyarchaeia archaeon]
MLFIKLGWKMGIQNLTHEVKEFALQQDVDLVGIADVERFVNAPPGLRPTDFLPRAKSVIVLGFRLPLGALEAAKRSYEGLRSAAQIYGVHAYQVVPNLRLLFAANALARFLEKKGFITMPLPSGPLGGLTISHRHAAVAAGLGEFGWMGLAVTPQYGPRQRWVSVITRAELEPDPLYKGPKLCDRSKCSVCVKVCPTGAIPEGESKRVVIGDRIFEYAKINPAKCAIACEGLREFGIPLPENPTWEDLEKLRQLLPRFPPGSLFTPYPTYFCGRCLIYCPIGEDKLLKEYFGREE